MIISLILILLLLQQNKDSVTSVSLFTESHRKLALVCFRRCSLFGLYCYSTHTHTTTNNNNDGNDDDNDFGGRLGRALAGELVRGPGEELDLRNSYEEFTIMFISYCNI